MNRLGWGFFSKVLYCEFMRLLRELLIFYFYFSGGSKQENGKGNEGMESNQGWKLEHVLMEIHGNIWKITKDRIYNPMSNKTCSVQLFRISYLHHSATPLKNVNNPVECLDPGFSKRALHCTKLNKVIIFNCNGLNGWPVYVKAAMATANTGTFSTLLSSVQ